MSEEERAADPMDRLDAAADAAAAEALEEDVRDGDGADVTAEPEMKDSEAGERPEEEAAEDEAEDDSEDAEDDGAAEEGGTEEEAAPQKVADDLEVEVDGETITLAALKAGYMRGEDFHRATAEMANERVRFAQEAEQLLQVREALVRGIETILPPEPDQNLQYSDPQTYIAMQQYRQQVEANLAQLLETVGEAAQQHVSEAEQMQRDMWLREQHRQLIAEFPEARSEKGMQKVVETAVSMAREYGFSDEEIESAIADARLIKLMHDAKAYRDGKAKVQKAKAKARPRKSVPARKSRSSSKKGESVDVRNLRGKDERTVATSLPDDMF